MGDNNTQQALEQLEGANEATNSLLTQNAQNRARQYNYLTGEAYAEDLSPEEYARIEKDNALAEKIGEYFGQEGATYTPQNVMAIAGNGWANLNERYGGASGINRHYYNPQLVENIGKAYRDRQAKSQADAVAAAQAEADKDVTLDYGEGRQYTITKDNAEEIKKLATIAGNTSAPANLRQQATQQLITALQAAGYNLGDIDAASITNADELFNKVSEGEGGLNRYMDLANILQEANRDRTPVKPEQKDLITLFQERQERQAEIDRATEQKRIENERLGRGIAGLAASISDMVRASEGARVDPRDWQRIYDNLTAQEKANINNYQVRMQKAAADARAQRMAEAQAAAKAKEAEAGRQHDIKLQLMKDKAAAERGDTEAAARVRVAQIAADAKKKAAQIAADAKKNQTKSSKSAANIRAFGKVNFIDASQFDSTMEALYGMLKAYDMDFGIKDQVQGMDKVSEIAARVLPALQSATHNEDTKKWKITVPKAGGVEEERELTDAQVEPIIDYLEVVAGYRNGGSNNSNGGGFDPDVSTL